MTFDFSKKISPVKRLSVSLVVLLAIVAIFAGPTSSCACIVYERMTSEGLYYPVNLQETILFGCNGTIRFNNAEARFPTPWEMYWYRTQIAIAKRDCKVGATWAK